MSYSRVGFGKQPRSTATTICCHKYLLPYNVNFHLMSIKIDAQGSN